MHGILLLDKAAGISSAKAIAQVKGRLAAKKIGHAGTLDPGATGLLVCLLGNATRLASIVEAGIKRYSGTIKFGITTSTDDLEGEPLGQHPVNLDGIDLKSLAQSFTGDLQQIPPQISAVKVAGKRSYERARSGEHVALKAREVKVYSLELKRESSDLLSFSLVSSKGFYVRSLARDMGEKLGCGAALSTLRRESSSPFEVANAKTLEQISAADVISVSALFPASQQLHLDSDLAYALYKGNEIALKSVAELASSSLSEKNNFLYFDQKDLNTPLGVLSYLNSSWRIALNF